LAHRHTGIYTAEAEDSGMRIIEGKERIERDYPDYLRDESNMHGTGASKLFFPRTEANLLWVVREALRRGEKLTISGGRTGICGGAVPEGGWMLSLERMNRVKGIYKSGDGFEIEVESGMRLSELGALARSRFAREKRPYFYPPDPTETTATIGGTVATNASGARTFFYGPTRRYVTGISLVLPTGELLVIKRGDVAEKDGWFTVGRKLGPPLKVPSPQYPIPSTKHSAGIYSKPGMDLIDLFIGSEGILGIISSVTVRLLQQPLGHFAGIGFFGDETRALRFVTSARRMKKGPLALEYFDSSSLLLLEETRRRQGPTSEIPDIPEGGEGTFAVYFESALEGAEDLERCAVAYKKLVESAGGDTGIAWGAVNKRDLERLKSFRHALPETVNSTISEMKKRDPGIHKVGTDMAVPDERLSDMVAFYREVLERESIRHVIFGHIGNNHLHVNLIPKDSDELVRAKQLYKIFAKRAVEWGGSVSAEHGIGKLKRQYLSVQYTAEEIERMRTIKNAFDPEGVLNPGDVLE
jgi:D-lactate dehydrogenase (cytochrome)